MANGELQLKQLFITVIVLLHPPNVKAPEGTFNEENNINIKVRIEEF